MHVTLSSDKMQFRVDCFLNLIVLHVCVVYYEFPRIIMIDRHVV